MQIIQPTIIDKPFNIAIVASRFNEEITSKLFQGALLRIEELGILESQVTVVWVPGAIEIPIVAKQLANSNRYEAIICLGAVIRGETSHYDYVCEQVSQGCQQVALSCDIPIIFGVLMTDNEAQALERLGGEHGHKGKESVDTAAAMISILRQINL